jgi:hypothetical protein
VVGIWLNVVPTSHAWRSCGHQWMWKSWRGKLWLPLIIGVQDATAGEHLEIWILIETRVPSQKVFLVSSPVQEREIRHIFYKWWIPQ